MTEDPAPYGRAPCPNSCSDPCPALCSGPPSGFEAQYRRVLAAAGCKTQAQLAAFLELRQSSVSDAKRRKAVPFDWLEKLFEKKRINPEWVRCGTGAKHLAPMDAEQNLPHIVRVMEVRPPHECSAQDLFNELVRRALQEPDIAASQKTVADSRLPVAKIGSRRLRPFGRQNFTARAFSL